MSKLVAIGCSFTDDYINIKNKIIGPVEKIRGYPVWPTILSRKLNMDVVNLGKIGAGNKYIFDQVVGLNGYIDLVIIMWSGWERENVGTDKTLEYMVESKNYLIKNNHHYIFVQGVHATFDPRTDDIKKLINSKNLEEFDNSNFIGWPIFSEIGGWCIEDKMEERHRYSEHDRHPNKEGHEFIADLFYKKYKGFYK